MDELERRVGQMSVMIQRMMEETDERNTEIIEQSDTKQKVILEMFEIKNELQTLDTSKLQIQLAEVRMRMTRHAKSEDLSPN